VATCRQDGIDYTVSGGYFKPGRYGAMWECAWIQPAVHTGRNSSPIAEQNTRTEARHHRRLRVPLNPDSPSYAEAGRRKGLTRSMKSRHPEANSADSSLAVMNREGRFWFGYFRAHERGGFRAHDHERSCIPRGAGAAGRVAGSSQK